MLLQLWSKATLNLEEVSEKWCPQVDRSDLTMLYHLVNEVDRVEYAHYLFNGQIFEQKEALSTGNPTFFCSPKNYKMAASENIFHSIDEASLDYKESLKASVEEKRVGQLSRFRKNIKDGKIKIILEVQTMTPDKNAVLTRFAR